MADLDAALRPYVDSGAVPGLVALVSRGDDVELAVLGSQGPDGAPMRRDSVFRGASITKPLTAALAMLLVEDGLLDLDAPVGLLMPELAEPRVLRTPTSALDDTVACSRPITARHLLMSTAGHGFATVESPVVPLLVERLGQSSMDVGAVPAPDEWMRRLADIPLIHQPGAQQREMGGFFLDGQGWGFGGGVDTSVRQPWNVVGRYGWVGGTGTAAYVDPQHATVSVVLTQIELGGPDSVGVLEAFWTAAAP